MTLISFSCWRTKDISRRKYRTVWRFSFHLNKFIILSSPFLVRRQSKENIHCILSAAQLFMLNRWTNERSAMCGWNMSVFFFLFRRNRSFEFDILMACFKLHFTKVWSHEKNINSLSYPLISQTTQHQLSIGASLITRPTLTAVTNIFSLMINHDLNAL